jgi:uncharacterized protein (TIGR04255 family)
MAKPRKLSRPPIQEAVIQFRFSEARVGREELEPLRAFYSEKGWVSEEVHEFEATIGPHSGTSETFPMVESNTVFQGFVLKEAGGRRLVQIWTDRVTASAVQAYDSWEALEQLVKEVFELYVSHICPDRVTQISTRFINRIPGIASCTSFESILERPPLAVDGVPGARVADFLRRHVLDGIAGDFMATLTIGTVPHEAGEEQVGRPLVIDTDVVKSGQFEPIFDLLKTELTGLREIKNALFFGSITDATVENFV